MPLATSGGGVGQRCVEIARTLVALFAHPASRWPVGFQGLEELWLRVDEVGPGLSAARGGKLPGPAGGEPNTGATGRTERKTGAGA